AAAHTRLVNLRLVGTLNMTGLRIGGVPTCRSRAGNTILTSSDMNTTATVTSHSRDSQARPTYFARNWSHGSGQHAMTFRQFARDASSATLSLTIPLPGRKVGTSTPDGRNSQKSVCVRLSSMLSISNGSTQKLCTAHIKDPVPFSKIPT